MAKHSSNPLEYIISITKDQLQSLSQIRHFNNLRVAYNGDEIWVKDFEMDQIDSVEVHTLPFKSVFYLKDSLLFPKDSLLPKSKLPPMLLWSSIEQALILEEPQINHNFFGIHDQISPKIVSSKEEKETIAILTPIHLNTKKVIGNSAAYRFKKLRYTIINSDSLLIIGTPILPVQGESYWMDDDFLFPNGYYFEYPMLSSSIKKLINPSSLYYVMWDKNSKYHLIPKSDCLPLSISSFRLSMSTPQL